MTTPHDTLAELQPLMETLGWWPKQIWRMSPETTWLYEAENQPEACPIEDEHALAIVTQRAEKELCGKCWVITKPGFECPADYRNPHKSYPSDEGPYEVSLADALRVEIGRQGKNQ